MTAAWWRAIRRPAWLVVAAAGLLACLVSLSLPWRDSEIALPVGARLVMAITGVALLTVLAGRPRGGSEGTLGATGLLGGCLVAYPTLLALAAVEPAPLLSALGLLAGGWHVLPLLLVQLAPVLATHRVLGRTSRRWEWTIVACCVVSAGATVLVLAEAPGLGVWTVISTAVFIASFLLAPIACWTAIAGTGGETRRRITLAAVASMCPVVIIVWCSALAVLAAGLGVGDDLAVTVLLLGFSVGALLCGLAVIATTAPAGSKVLRTRVVVLALDLLIAALVLIAGSVLALLLPADVVSPAWALLCGGALVAVLVLPWLRLHHWIVRVVDPTAELRHELAVVGDAADGSQRQTVLRVLRRLVEDPGLELYFRVDPQTWVDAMGAPVAGPDVAVVSTTVLGTRAGDPSVLARVAGAESHARLAALGDLTSVLQPALLEAAVGHETARAERAAEQERRQLERDLHDGLQGRLLGLALNLQLSGRDIDDPGARLLLEETVQSLRSTVDDVRALGAGRQPELLARRGLAPALDALFRHVRPVVTLDVGADRYPAEAEATAYFVVGEAVTNALKHAGAQHVGVQIRRRDASLLVAVSDDGCGGADPRLGSGLRGLAERVTAAGGALVVRDGLPSGTVVEAVVPCGS